MKNEKTRTFSSKFKNIPLLLMASVGVAFAGSLSKDDFACSIYHVIGNGTTGYNLITVAIALIGIAGLSYGVVKSIKEKKADLLFILIGIVGLVLATTWGNVVDKLGDVSIGETFIETAPDNCSSN
jgi:hypothetical protein